MESRFDYIVVGAGSAGCVVASRLSEDPACRVLLLDAGPDSAPQAHAVTEQELSWIRRPALFQYMQDSRLDWSYWTEPQPGLGGRSVFTPRGKVVGGSSTFIAGLFVRGDRADFDGWAHQGNTGWSYQEVKPYFLRSERNLRQGISREYHNTKGPLTVSDLPSLSAATRTYLAACRDLGYRPNDDFNGPDQEGFGVYQFYVDDQGRRVNSANGYLTADVRSRPNLYIRDHSVVERLLVSPERGSARATGVRLLDRSDGGRTAVELTVRREVILSAGALDSPRLLMLSGIGPREELDRHGIPVVHVLPGVGRNLHDHLVVPTGYLYRPGTAPREVIGSAIDGGMFLKSNSGLAAPDLQFVFNHALLGPPGDILPIGFQLVPVMLHPWSRGRVRLLSPFPFAPPMIDAGYLSDPRDLPVLMNAMRHTLRILHHGAFDAIRGDRIPEAPAPPANASDREIEDYIRRSATSLFHPAGTCRMGPAGDPNAVVDPELRVCGVEGLRVVDASVMPTITSGNLHTPTVMIGEKGADMISRRAGAGAATSAVVPSPFSFPPGVFPPGVAPETYRNREVTRLLEQAAYLSIFSIHNPSRPNIPIPSPRDPGRLIGVEVHEDLHRFDVGIEPPGCTGGLRASKRVGEPVATVQIRWLVIPDDFNAGPGRVPPPTELDPTRSQRFAMLDGRLSFQDRAQSGFRAFGTGRTFPVLVGGRPQLRIGAVIDILEGFGQFQGLPGTVCVNGYITPPQGLALNLLLRFVDATGRLRTSSQLKPPQEIPDPDPESVFLFVLGEVDPDHPTTIQQASAEGIRASVHERLRLIRVGFDMGSPRGIRSRTEKGLVVGTLRGTLQFNPNDPNPVTPIRTTDGVFTFFDQRGRTVATLNANIVEGRAFRTALPGAPLPVFRFGGFGSFLGGTGPFRDAIGMISLNAAISVFPRTLSNLYVLRVSDPDGRFRARLREAWPLTQR
jgi:choline dehydrogenase